MLVLRTFCRLQVGVNIRPTKAVNRLLRVANEKHPWFGNFAVHLGKNFILNRVSILKLINQCCLVFFPQTLRKLRVLQQRTVDVQQQIIEGQNAALLLTDR